MGYIFNVKLPALDHYIVVLKETILDFKKICEEVFTGRMSRNLLSSRSGEKSIYIYRKSLKANVVQRITEYGWRVHSEVHWTVLTPLGMNSCLKLKALRKRKDERREISLHWRQPGDNSDEFYYEKKQRNTTDVKRHGTPRGLGFLRWEIIRYGLMLIGMIQLYNQENVMK